MKSLLIGLLFSALALGQINTQPRSAFICYQSASSAAAVVTVQLPANANRGVHLIGAFATCSNGCNVAQELMGTAASSTAFAPISLNDRTSTSSAKCYTASNSSAGSNVIPSLPVSAGSALPLDLSNVRLASGFSITQLFTLRTDNATGTNAIAVVYEEIP